MTPKEALTNIGKLIGAIKFTVAPGKFDDGKLSDGTAIQYSALETGGDISLVDAQGVATPAPVGQYELEDGRIIIVTEAGKISEVKDAVPATPDAAAGSADTPAPAAAQAMADGDPTAPAAPGTGIDWQPQIDDMSRSLAYMAERLTALQNAMQSFSSATQAAMSANHELVVTLASEDKSGAITPPKQTVFSETKDKKESAKAKAEAGFAAFAEQVKAQKAAAAKV